MITQEPLVRKTRFLSLDYTVAAGLCYIPIHFLLFLPFQAAWAGFLLWKEPKTSAFVRFHATQSLLILLPTAAAVGVAAVSEVLIGLLPGDRIQGLALALRDVTIGGVLLVVLYQSVLGAVKGFKGQYWQMPLLGRFAPKLPLLSAYHTS